MSRVSEYANAIALQNIALIYGISTIMSDFRKDSDSITFPNLPETNSSNRYSTNLTLHIKRAPIFVARWRAFRRDDNSKSVCSFVSGFWRPVSDVTVVRASAI